MNFQNKFKTKLIFPSVISPYLNIVAIELQMKTDKEYIILLEKA